MPLPRNIAAYADVRAVIDAAMAQGGAVYTPVDHTNEPSAKRAHYWLMRARTFRRLAFDNGEPGYADFDFILEENKISIRIAPRLLGSLVSLEGKSLDVSAPAPDLDIDIDALREEFFGTKK
jgi:hypothetical protein